MNDSTKTVLQFSLGIFMIILAVVGWYCLNFAAPVSIILGWVGIAAAASSLE